MLDLEADFPHTRLLSTLCAACPFGPAGCCAGPPDFDWSDLGRVVRNGGLAFLLAELGRGNLVRVDRGLAIKRVKRKHGTQEARGMRCVHHGPKGCTIAADLRPATCNYYICEAVYAEGREKSGPEREAEALRTHRALIDFYERLDDELARAIAERYPGGPPFDAAFLTWLGERFAEAAEPTVARTAISLGCPRSE